MRRALDALYAASGWLAAGFVAAIAALVAAQVALNTADKIAAAAGGTGLGLTIPSYADFTGFFLAAATFLALAHTLKRGAHIRVTLLAARAPPGFRKWLDLWALGVSAGLAGYLTWWSAALMLDSLRFGDLSSGMVPVPLWLPQCALVAGMAIFTVALVDEWVITLRSGAPSFHDMGEGLLEEGRDDV